MSPLQVTQFVETYRYDCSIRQQPVDACVRPSNACIAYLLCEEARARWLSLKSRKPLPDIACVVVEFHRYPEPMLKGSDRTVKVARNKWTFRRLVTDVRHKSRCLTRDSAEDNSDETDRSKG